LVYNYENKGRHHQEYIRFNKQDRVFSWEEQPSPYYIEEKAERIKAAKKWNEVLRSWDYAET
jgi:hypothetical protein